MLGSDPVMRARGQCHTSFMTDETPHDYEAHRELLERLDKEADRQLGSVAS